jgi:hypothetical protein
MYCQNFLEYRRGREGKEKERKRRGNTKKNNYRTRAIITRGLYTFYPLFEVHICTVTFGLMYG